ncbi:pentapeptide repeat-containing protein [Streptomyces sp. NPDC001922]|uniref:pentapeptide repeat-containing protein n=1 Tax=Streptomyces sp. NPDC001922 TaxID=3364624 RepID=UPI00368DA0FF
MKPSVHTCLLEVRGSRTIGRAELCSCLTRGGHRGAATAVRRTEERPRVSGRCDFGRVGRVRCASVVCRVPRPRGQGSARCRAVLNSGRTPCCRSRERPGGACARSECPGRNGARAHRTTDQCRNERRKAGRTGGSVRSPRAYADMHGADMRGADMHGADMRGADMRGADMRGADVRGCGVERFPCSDLHRSAAVRRSRMGRRHAVHGS